MAYEVEEIATIKKPDQVDYISKEEYENRVREIVRCKKDINYFAEKYFKIINLDKGLMTIQLYPKQKELLKFFVNEKRCICLASRQSSKCVGFWTIVAVRHRKYHWLKIKLPIGVFYIVAKLLNWVI